MNILKRVMGYTPMEGAELTQLLNSVDAMRLTNRESHDFNRGVCQIKPLYPYYERIIAVKF